MNLIQTWLQRITEKLQLECLIELSATDIDRVCDQFALL